MTRPAHQIAADMLCCGKGDPHKLHHRLFETITEAHDLARGEGAELRSRQVIAVLVLMWMHINPEEQAYGG